MELARTHPTGFGYLLKDRVLDVSTLIDAVQRVAGGGTVLDPDIVAHFLGRQAARDRLRELTDNWHEQCAVCKASGKIARGHRHWSACTRMQDGTEKMAEAIKIL